MMQCELTDKRHCWSAAAVNTAYKALTDSERREYSQKVVEEARAMLEEDLVAERKAAKKAGQTYTELEPAVYDDRLKKMVSKLFVEYYQRAQKLDVRPTACSSEMAIF